MHLGLSGGTGRRRRIPLRAEKAGPEGIKQATGERITVEAGETKEVVLDAVDAKGSFSPGTWSRCHTNRADD